MLNLPRRSAGDILSRTVTVTLGGQEYSLLVRSIADNRAWRLALDEATVHLLDGLETDELSAVYDLLSGQIEVMIDLLLSYDTEGVLPTREAIEAIEPDASIEVIDAVREVWLAANPLVAASLRLGTEAQAAIQSGALSPPTSGLPLSGAGRPDTSTAN